tara:strand:- start:281 stop:463 length:183 start_codon:yes stop_codon:yes gene_type:complete
VTAVPNSAKLARLASAEARRLRPRVLLIAACVVVASYATVGVLCVSLLSALESSLAPALD